MQYHPKSPVKKSEVRIDITRRSYVVRGAAAYRIKSSVVEIKPRKFQVWVDLAECIGKSAHVIS